MKECLNCQEGFEAKRESRKFCSDSCRVLYNRKHGKQNKVTPLQMTVLHNQMMDALGEMKEIREQIVSDLVLFGQARTDGQTISNIKPNTPLSVVPVPNGYFGNKTPQTGLKSFEQWKQAKHECELEEDWEKIKAGIMAATNLSPKQKDLLIKYS